MTSQAGHTLYPASAEILGRSNAPNELERPKLKRPKLIQEPSTGSFSVCALATWDEQALNQDIQKVGQEIRCLGSVFPNHGPPNNTNCCLKTLWLGGMLTWNSPIGNLLNSQPASLSVLLADPQSASIFLGKQEQVAIPFSTSLLKNKRPLTLVRPAKKGEYFLN